LVLEDLELLGDLPPRIPAKELMQRVGLDPRSRAHIALLQRVALAPGFTTHAGAIRWEVRALRPLGAPRSVSAVSTYIGLPVVRQQQRQPTTTANTTTAIEEGQSNG